MHDVRYAFRTFRKQPLFTLAAVLTLTLAIGANTAVFSLMYQVLLRPLPYAQADRLVYVWNAYTKAGDGPSHVAIPDYLDRRSQAAAIEDATLFTPRNASLSVTAEPEQVVALAVTPSFFTTLGRAPFLGRPFTDADVAGFTAARVVIVTYATWRSRFGGDAAVVGRAVRVNGETSTVVGVLPRDFDLPARDAAILLPFAFTAAQASDQERGSEFSLMIARLRPGATIPQVNAQMQSIVDGLMERVPRRAAFMRRSGFTGRATTLRSETSKGVVAPLLLVQAAVVVVLVIACVNVGNLVLMRATGRRRELAIRAAIGAGAGRILRQLIVEGCLLSGAGGLLGAALGVLGLRALVRITADQLPGTVTASLDVHVLAAAFTMTTLCGLVFGAVPAIGTLRNDAAAAALREDSSRGTAGRHTRRLTQGFVGAQTALAVLLLVAAGLLVKSLARLTDVPTGFEAERVLTGQIALPEVRYPDADSQRAFWNRLIAQLRAIPGVPAAGLVSIVPFSGDFSSGSFDIAGVAPGPGEQTPHAFQDLVLGDYFRAMQIPLVEGRLFTDGDAATAPRVVIVDRLLAQRHFPDGHAVGKQLNFGSPRNYTIVGVVGTVSSQDLASPAAEGRIYFAATQLPSRTMWFAIKAASEPALLAPQVREAVRAIDPEQPIARVRPMEDWVGRSLQPRRGPAVLLSLFGAIALALAAIGLYGVLAFGVAERVREFGIRQALGADRAAILSLVLTQGLRTAGVGLALGLGGALALARYLRSLLFGVTTHDAGVFATATILLLAVAVLACYLPARRATRIDPMVALRDS